MKIFNMMLILKFLKTDIAKSHFDLSQMINEPMNVLDNTSSYNLIFTSQANLITCSGVGSSLQPNWHHQRSLISKAIILHHTNEFGTISMLILN